MQKSRKYAPAFHVMSKSARGFKQLLTVNSKNKASCRLSSLKLFICTILAAPVCRCSFFAHGVYCCAERNNLCGIKNSLYLIWRIKPVREKSGYAQSNSAQQAALLKIMMMKILSALKMLTWSLQTGAVKQSTERAYVSAMTILLRLKQLSKVLNFDVKTC